MIATTRIPLPHAEVCTPVARPACRPTPPIEPPLAGRWLTIPFCVCESLVAILPQHLRDHLVRTEAMRGFPLSASQVEQIVSTIQDYVPPLRPATCCTDMHVWLTHADIYALQTWRYWWENSLADQFEHSEGKTIGGAIHQKYIETCYAWLTRLKKALTTIR